MTEYILSPKACRVTKKRAKKELLDQQKTSYLSTDTKLDIQKCILKFRMLIQEGRVVLIGVK